MWLLPDMRITAAPVPFLTRLKLSEHPHRPPEYDQQRMSDDRFCTPDAVTKLVRAIEQGGRDCIGSHADLVYVEGERIIRTWHMGDGRLADGWLPGHPTLFLTIPSVQAGYGLLYLQMHKMISEISSLPLCGCYRPYWSGIRSDR